MLGPRLPGRARRAPVAAASSRAPAPAVAAALPPACPAGYTLLPLSFGIGGTVGGSAAAGVSTGRICPAQDAACAAAVAQGGCADATTQAPTLAALTAALQACPAGGAPAPSATAAPVLAPSVASPGPSAGPSASLSATTAGAAPAALSPGAGGCAIVGGQPCWQAATSTWPCPNEVDGTEHVCGAAELHTLQSGLPWCAKAQDCLAGVGCKVGTKYVGGSGH